MIQMEHLKLGKELGSGEFGAVYRGVWNKVRIPRRGWEKNPSYIHIHLYLWISLQKEESQLARRNDGGKKSEEE